MSKYPAIKCLNCDTLDSIDIEQLSAIYPDGEDDWYVGDASRVMFKCSSCRRQGESANDMFEVVLVED